MKRKLFQGLAVLLAASVLLFAMMTACDDAAGGGGGKGGGNEEVPFSDGTEEHPHGVYDVATLKRVGTETTIGGWTLSAYYTQTKDIDMSGQSCSIGSEDKPFTGTYNGKSHKITNLSSNQGLFVSVMGGSVFSVNLVNCTINSTKSDVGGIAGAAYNDSTISNCYVKGTVNGRYNVGGIVGYVGNINDYSKVSMCHADVKVTGLNSLGGVAGKNDSWNTVIKNCSSSGEVTGTSDSIGGVVGENNGIVNNVFSTCTVSGNQVVGGIVGDNYGSGNASNPNWAIVSGAIALNPDIKRTGQGTYQTFGRIAGRNNPVSGKVSGGGGGARADMKLPDGITVVPVDEGNKETNKDGEDFSTGRSLSSIFAGWDTSIWNIPSGNLTVNGALPSLRDIPASLQNPTLP